VDKIGPKANGFYEFYYEFDDYKFAHGLETLHARSYTHGPEEAFLSGIELDDQWKFLAKADLRKPLARAAQEYLRRAGKTDIKWLDPKNKSRGDAGSCGARRRSRVAPCYGQEERKWIELQS